jgi:uncharacterized surface protein with fasciclin (FAS1) repeats
MNSETPKNPGASDTPQGSQPASKPPESRSESEASASEPENKEPERAGESEASDQERESKAREPALESKPPALEPESKAEEATSETKPAAPEPESKDAEPASETEPAEPPPPDKPTEPGAAPADDWPAKVATYRRYLEALRPRAESERTTPEPVVGTAPPRPPRPPTPPERGRKQPDRRAKGSIVLAWAKYVWKSADRMAKYAVLLLLALVTLRLVFDCYSYYSARRDIDAELQSKRVSSLEYLNILSQRTRALALSTLEARCLERAQLTLFRITEIENEAAHKAYDALMDVKSGMIKILGESALDAEKVKKVSEYINGPRFELLKIDEHLKELDDGRNSEAFKRLNENLEKKRKEYIDAVQSQAPLRERIEQIMRAYGELVAQKNAMVKILEQSGLDPNDAREAIEYIDGSGFELAQLDEALEKLGARAGNSDKFTKLKADLDKEHKRYIEIAGKHAPLRARIEPLLGGAYPSRVPSFWTMDALKTVVDRIDQLRKERDTIRERYGDIDDVLARYAVWTSALTGRAADSPVLDDVAYQVSGDDNRSLAAVRCDRFKDYYAAVTRQLLNTDSPSNKPWQKLQLKEIPAAVYGFYNDSLFWYFKKPPAAQTLMVTLLLGALGALTLNTLRLSRVGWWANHPDPFWGEIFVGPLLGALAAFGIFLIGSAGLLLTSDARSAQPLSTAFIGLLGFVSGLLYDEAFGRVRRVGSQIFAGTSDVQIAAARTEDRTLAEALKGASASRAAELVLKYGIGTRLGTEREFTLLLPSDEAMGALSLAEWNRLNEDRKAFEPWYTRHYVEQRLSRAALPALKDKPKPKPGDGPELDLEVKNDVLTVNGIRAVVPDVQWNKGVVHILERDLRPESSSDAAPAPKKVP